MGETNIVNRLALAKTPMNKSLTLPSFYQKAAWYATMIAIRYGKDMTFHWRIQFFRYILMRVQVYEYN